MTFPPAADSPDNSRRRPKQTGDNQSHHREGPPRQRPMSLRFTDRDRQLCSFVTRFGAATYEHIECLWATSEWAVRQRIPRLAQAGFLTIHPRHGVSNVVTATLQGQQACGVFLTAPDVERRNLDHLLAVTQAGAVFESRGLTTLCDRQLALVNADSHHHPPIDWAAGTSYGVCDPNARHYLPAKWTAGHHGPRATIPDLVVTPTPSSPLGTAVAIEVQRTRPSSKALSATIDAYARTGTSVFDSVIYIAEHSDVRTAITNAIRKHHATNVYVVSHVTDLFTNG